MSLFKYSLMALLAAGLLFSADPSTAQRPAVPVRPGEVSPPPAAPYDLHSYYERARQAYQSGNHYETAVAIQDASFEVERAAVAANGPNQPFLTQVRDKLNDLALTASLGKLGGMEPINQAFGDGFRAMADFFYDRAREAWEARDQNGAKTEAALEGYPAGNPVTNAGYYLRAATENIQSWAETTGQRLSRSGIDLLNASQNVTVPMIQGSGGNATQISALLDDFGRMMHDTSRWVQPNPGSSRRN